MPFSTATAKKILHNFERQQSGQKSLILAELAAMHEGKTTSQPLDFEAWLESSNQAFEYIESLLKALESEKGSYHSCGNINFCHHCYSLYCEKMPILRSMVEL